MKVKTTCRVETSDEFEFAGSDEQAAKEVARWLEQPQVLGCQVKRNVGEDRHVIAVVQRLAKGAEYDLPDSAAKALIKIGYAVAA